MLDFLKNDYSIASKGFWKPQVSVSIGPGDNRLFIKKSYKILEGGQLDIYTDPDCKDKIFSISQPSTVQRTAKEEYCVFEDSTGVSIGRLRRTQSKFIALGWDILDQNNGKLAVINKTINLNSFFTTISSIFGTCVFNLPIFPRYFRQNFVIKSKDGTIANLLSKRGHFGGEMRLKFDSNITDRKLSYLILAAILLAFDQLGNFDLEGSD